MHVLATSEDSRATPPTYPATVKVRMPHSLVHELAAYGVDGVVLLAPVGWTEKSASIAWADGGSAATLEAGPDAAMPGQLDYEDDPDCFDSWSKGALYFPWVRRNWPKESMGFSCPKAPVGLTEHFDGSQLVRYSLRGSSKSSGDLEVSGLAQTALSPRNPNTQGFTRLQVSLPHQDVTLATIMLGYYEGHYTHGGNSREVTPTPAASDTAQATPAPAESSTSQGVPTLPGIGGTQTFYDSSNPRFNLAVTLDTTDSTTAQGGGYLYGVKLTIGNLSQYSYTANIENAAKGLDPSILLYQADGSTSDATWTDVAGTRALRTSARLARREGDWMGLFLFQ